MEYCVFTDKAKAEAALKEINDNLVFPIRGVNAATGKLATNDKCKTEKWAELLEFTDGTFGFPAVNNVKLKSILSLSDADITTYTLKHKPTIKEIPGDQIVPKVYTPCEPFPLEKTEGD